MVQMKLLRMNYVESLDRELPTLTMPSRGSFRPVPYLVVCATLATGLGCHSEEDIRAYNVPKSPEAQATTSTPRAPAAQGVPSRMLAAVVPQAEQSWFFKLMGPEALVAKQRKPFLELIRSIQVEGADAPPQWELPEGWTQEQGSGMRFATIHPLPDEPTVELTVIPLPTAGDDETEYVISNINRWRNQLGLGPMAAAELEAAKTIDDAGESDAILRVPLGDELEAVVVDISGTSAPSTGAAGPFAAGGMQGPMVPQGPVAPQGPMPPQGSPVGSPSSRPTAKSASSLKYEVPEAWTEKTPDGIRKAAFQIDQDGKSAEVTVIDLPESGLVPNVNRWRGQIGLAPLSPAEIDQQVEAIEIDGHAGHYVEMWTDESAPKPEAILAAIVSIDGQSWFIKLQGDAALAEAERDAFRAFYESIRF